ncbi:MAG: TolC family protein [Bacteroidota bacterium]
MRKLSILIVFILFAFYCHAQPWSLQQCIDYAFEHNISIKQNELNNELAEFTLLRNKANALPGLNANISHIYNFGRTVDPFTNEFAAERVLSNSFSVSSSVTLFNGFQTLNTIRQSQLDLLASRYDVDKARNDISLAIAGSYLQILFNEELVEIARNQVGIIKQQLGRTKKLVEAGSLAKGNLLDIEAQVAMDELQLVNAENQLDMSYLDLIQLLDLDPLSDFKIANPDIEISEEAMILSTPGQIYGAALSTQPQIKSAEYKVGSSLKSLLIAKGGRSPRLTIAGSYGTGYSNARKNLLGYSPTGDSTTIGYTTTNIEVVTPSFNYMYETTPFSDQVNDNINQSVGFNLSIPIFNGLLVKTSISRAKIAIKNAEYNLQLLKNQLNKNIQQAHANARAALKRYHATEKTVTALLEAFNYTEQKFDVGMLASVEYNDAKNKLVKAKSDLLQAKYDYVFKTKVLNFYQGKSLAF